MATIQKLASNVKQPQLSTAVARLTIAEQTAAFLKAGGQIDQIPQGKSGQPSLAGPKHIVIAKKPEQSKV